MFQPGTIVKVKVESSPGEYGFGRATIVERVGNQLLVQVKTSRDPNKIFPKGTKIWFVNDSPRLTFNGLWQSTVLGTQIIKGRTVLVCAAPKLEHVSQKRKVSRVSIDIPVTMSLDLEGREKQEFRTIDLCKSGTSLESTRIDQVEVESGREIQAILHSKEGDISLTARVLRVEHNWLANKTVIALEFVALPQESADALDKLLVRLGGKPRDAGLDEGDSAREGMSSWVHLVKKGGADGGTKDDHDEDQHDGSEPKPSEERHDTHEIEVLRAAFAGLEESHEEKEE